MKKIMINSLLVLGAVTMPQPAAANTAPHWLSHGIDCIDCHQNHMGPKTACAFCHNNTTGTNYTKTSAPAMLTHSSAVMQSDKYGDWQRACVDCHDPHVSDQCATPLVSGSFSAYASGGGTTTFTVNSRTVNDPDWQNPAFWNAKTGPGRGLIFLAEGLIWDTEQGKNVDFSSEIMSADATSVTVQGEINQISTVRDFKILYGQYVKTTVDTASVNFPGPSALAHDESGTGIDASPDGICQVCHTLTKYWRKDGSRATHFNGEYCVTCHEHELGFRPSCNACHGFPPVVDGTVKDGLIWNPEPTGATSAGAHATHAVDNGMPCETCHYNGMPVTPIVDDYKLQIGFDIAGQNTTGNAYDGRNLHPAYTYEGTNGTTVTSGGSMSCVVYCHSNGTSVSTGVLANNPSPSWTTGSTNCTSCHTYPPAYAQDQPKSNSHQRHIAAGFTCKTCHYGTTIDSTTIAPTGNHGNGRYDVIGAPTFFANGQNRVLNLVYEYDAGGGTCSTNSCHAYFSFNTPIRWGNFYLYASPSITKGTLSNQVNFQVNVTGCGTTPCNLPFTCTFDWGDGTIEERTVCTNSHVYPAPGAYNVTWNVWDSKNHSMENSKINSVTAEEIIDTGVVALGATVNAATRTATVTVPPTTTAGIPITKVYYYWGDRATTVINAPIVPTSHQYARAGTYLIKVVAYDQNYNKFTYTYLEEPSLQVVIP
ncbi:MAG: CxxxxCH/CxxCH domain-containing protein [Pseudomonadota bacterium]